MNILFCFFREHLARDAHKLLDRQQASSYSRSNNNKEKEELRPLEKRICRAVTAGFYMNSAALCAHGNVFKYLSLLDLERQRNRQEALDVRMVHIHPTSSLAVEGVDCPHSTLVYQALAHGNKLYMKQVCRADSRSLKQLQRDWVYVDPYVLCGRKHGAPVSTGAAAPSSDQHNKTSSSSSSGNSSAPVKNETSTSSAQSSDASAVPRPATGESTIGHKRPLADHEGGDAAAATRTPAASAHKAPVSAAGASAAAEAAKQRYLERMAQQKARK